MLIRYARVSTDPQMKDAWLILGERLDQLTRGLPREQADDDRDNEDRIQEA